MEDVGISALVARVLDEAIRDGRAKKTPGIGMKRSDVERYSIQRVLRHASRYEEIKDGLELEMHTELSRGRMGAHKVEGWGIPFDVFTQTRAMRDMTAGVFGQGGATVATDFSSSVIPLLRNTVTAIPSGVTVLDGLSGNLVLPRQTGASTATALPEITALTGSTPTLDQVTMTPHRTGAKVSYSRQLVLQSSISIENFLRKDLFDQIGLALDRFILNGGGAADEPLGIMQTPGIGSVTFGGTASWANVLNFENSLALANAETPGSKMAWITSPSVRNRWKQIAKNGTGVTSVVPIFIWEPTGDGSGNGVVNG